MSVPVPIRKPFPVSKVVVPMITIGVLFVLWRMNLKVATVPVIGFVLFYYLLLPRMVRARTAAFNRRALALLTTGRASEMPYLVKRSFFLQLFGARGTLDAKLALAYVQLEAYGPSIACFESGIPGSPLSEQVALRAGLAKALFAVGELARAEREASDIIERVTRLPELLAIAARSRAGLGRAGDAPRKWLEEAESLSPSRDVSLMITLARIELDLARGQKPEPLPEGADAASKLVRAWIHLVRGKLRARRGDTDKALQSFSKAKEILPGSFAAKEADGLAGALTPSAETGLAGAPMDPVIRRKKRRRK